MPQIGTRLSKRRRNAIEGAALVSRPPARPFIPMTPMFFSLQRRTRFRSSSLDSAESGNCIVSNAPDSISVSAVSRRCAVTPIWRIMPCALALIMQDIISSEGILAGLWN